MDETTTGTSTHRTNFDRFARQVNGDGPPWLDDLRRRGMAGFERVGFPSRKQEDWRHTNLDPIAGTHFELATTDARAAASAAAEPAGRFSFGDDAACELVFVNGRMSLELSRIGDLPRGARAGSLADALVTSADGLEQHLGRHADLERNPFVALNTGFIADGAFVHVPRGAVIERPIHLLFVSTPSAEPTVAHPRVLVLVEDAARATVVESYVGSNAGTYFTNAVTEIVAGHDALVDHYKLQQEGAAAYHIATMQVQVARGGTFVSHNASIGSRLTRNDLNVIMAGDGAAATLNGLVLIGGEQHVDNHTLLDHAAPNCPSHELYKHVLGGRATAVFRGKILVRQPAQKTDSKQSSKALLLSDDAVMNSQPALEIYADDVKCTHGSTTGPVDEEQVFYMRTRGVGLDAARHLMTYAFAADITRRIKVEPVRRRLEEYMAAQHGLPLDLRIADLGAHDEAVTNL
ncbi:MAG TPA: Fe-S cluster assembly protein SufD [Gemmataceae bacterium]|nr:Fe-S cluster assembly protein SufD [Gemmataceae bacterium]